MNYISLLLLMSTTFIHSFKFEERDMKTGLTFVELSRARIFYDSYTILYHVDITEFKKLIPLVEKFVLDSKKFCDVLRGGDRTITCDILLKQLSNQILYMKRDELDIDAFQLKNRKSRLQRSFEQNFQITESKSRARRALEVIGSIYHWAFGLMDAETARKYDAKIDGINGSVSRIHNLITEQTSLVKEVISLNNRTTSDLRFQLNKLTMVVNKYTWEAHKHANWVHAELTFGEGVDLANIIISEHQRISQQILKTIEDVVVGKITQLLPKDKLVDDLAGIQSLLRENQKLPIDFNLENPLHIFKYSKIATSLYGNRLLMEVTIPIVERESYTVYKIIPIPTTVDNKTVIINPSTFYILLSDKQAEYIPITEEEFTRGHFNMRGEKLINPAENARIDYSQNCEVSIFMNPSKEIISKYCDIKVIPKSNYFISLNANDMFYVNVATPIIVTEYCHGFAAKQQEIAKNGLIQISKECRITTDKISLRPRANYKFESKAIITLSNNTDSITFESINTKINYLQNISIPNIEDNILIQDYTSDFDVLFNKAEKLIEKSKLETRLNAIILQNEERTKKTYVFASISILVLISLIAGVGYYVYTRFFNIAFWIKLATKIDGNRLPKLFVRNINVADLENQPIDNAQELINIPMAGPRMVNRAPNTRSSNDSLSNNNGNAPLMNEYLRTESIGIP